MLCAACSSAPPVQTLAPVPSPVASAPPRLEKGISQEREIQAGEIQEYRIAMKTGDYARVSVDQTEVDVALRLVGPSGEEVGETNGVGRKKHPDLLSWIAGSGGDFRLIVTPHDPDGGGSYKVSLEELRPGTAGDPDRVAAERMVWEAQHWLSREDADCKRRALAGFAAALDRWEAAGDRVEIVDVLNQMGVIQRTLGETGAALDLYERALAHALEWGNRSGEAQTRNNLAVVYGLLGDSAKARQSYREALRIWEELEDSREIGTTLYNFGTHLLERGETQAALESLNRALEIRRAAGDRDTQARILTALGRAHLNAGDSDRALDLLGQALELSREQGDRHSEANALQHIAACHLRQGELQKALELYLRVLDLWELLGQQAQVGQVLSNLGATEIYLGNPDQALAHYRRALEIHQAMRNMTWEAYALWDIGWIHHLRQEHETALEHYTKAYEISAANPPVRALALQGMGRARLALGQPLAAGPLLERALELYRGTGNAVGEINTLLELGRVRRALSENDRAAALFNDALALSRKRQTLINEAVAQSAVAYLERDRGNLQAAAHAIEAALRIVESVRPKLAGQRLRASFFASRREYYDFYVDLQMRLHEKNPAAGHLAAALDASERARARALLDLLAEGRIDVQQGISPELKEKEAEITRRISRLQTRLIEDLSGRSEGSAQAAQLEADLIRAEEDRERLEWQVRREHPRYASIVHPSPLSLERIQALLDGRTALLEFSVGKERSFLFVVTRDGLAGFPLPAAGELSGQVETLRRALQTSGRRLFGSYVEAARQLYDLLIRPAEPLLEGKPRLIIAPDGPLALLSFETLLTAPPPAGSRTYGDLPYLIRERSLMYIPSASVLGELESPRPAAPGAEPAKLFLGFGAPDYGAPEEGQVHLAAAIPSAAAGPLERIFREAGLPHPQPLPESRTELSSIAALHPAGRVQLYLGPEAVEENVKNNPYLKTARRIHFAVHGFVNERQPELSGLVLALDGDPREDGLLQVYEIFNLELGADLVVLSACETGLGRNVRGEGLVGVARALLYAGASNIVVSLWQVADASTSDLMIRFYRHLGEDGDKAEALRLSKLEMIREGGFEHPYHWAPFILIGQPGRSSQVTSLPLRAPVKPG